MHGHLDGHSHSPDDWFSKHDHLLKKIDRIITRLHAPPDMHDDLAQEARVYLWCKESKRPGQTESWYLQGCFYHLEHVLKRGRSLDSTKHGDCNRLDVDEIPDGCLASNDDTVSEVCAHDVFSLLSDLLDPLEGLMLEDFAAGLGVSGIARKWNCDHQLVTKLRLKLVDTALRLGVSPPPKRRRSLRAEN